jgi:hypothetical protein
VFIVALFLVLKPIIPVLEYVVNYDYIATVLCINKDKPKLECNGKCHLMKEMAKASESEKPISNDKKSFSSELEVLFFQDLFQFSFRNSLPNYITNSFELPNNLYHFLSDLNCFHPPTIIS